MVAEDFLVYFLHGNSVLDFCDLINKNKETAAFVFLGGRDYNISKSFSKKCVGSIYYLDVSHPALEKSRDDCFAFYCNVSTDEGQ